MKKEVITITIDPKTKNLLDTFGKNHGLSRSSVIRLIANNYFLKEADKNVS